MRFGKILAAATVAASLVSAPVAAQAAGASALSVSAASARAGASLEDESNMGGGFLIPLLVIGAAVLAVLVIADGGDETPASN